MKTDKFRAFALLFLVLGLGIAASTSAWADEDAAEEPAAESTASEEASPGASVAAESDEKPKYPPFEELVKEPKTSDGLIKLHQSKQRLFAEIEPGQFDKDFIVIISIARGISQGSLLGGMSWGFGDDWIWQFRKVDDRVHIVRRNVRFKADSGSPAQEAVKLAYTDSVLYSLPIATMNCGNTVVDLTPVFMSDLPQISMVLSGFRFANDRSTWAEIKGFSDNMEIEVAATYASSGQQDFDTVPDSRGVTINVHYSISRLPATKYTPRLADDRVGYFLTAIKDFSKRGETDGFVRYINRWHLEKGDSKAELSPPKKPIVFYLEKTIPYAYRKPIREGIEEWNRAFEQAGFVNAIEVRQQSDRDTWDPEDINYNTFRWITASAGFAMGPSRVNPTNGQILDADIIFDADFVEYWKQEYETFTPESIAALTGGPLDLESYRAEIDRIPAHLRAQHQCRCQLHQGMGHELALGSAVATIRAAAAGKPIPREFIMQGLKEVTMHEVGHTLGLRHNFKASTYLTLDELNDPEKTAETGVTSSVMDYSPANIRPEGQSQGDYFSQTVGPYDIWAIEYGYKPLNGGTEGEREELDKIASRSGEPQLAYATDEDTRGIDSDPLSNRFDLGKDPVEYARLRADLIGELWPGLVDRTVDEGDGYQRARQAFGVLLGNYGRAVFFASRFVGGLYVHRHHKGDADGEPPFVVVSADKQREALALLEERVFSDKPFEFPPELYNHLAATRWSHWGMSSPDRLDIAVHEVILMWQQRVLSQILSPLVLTRLHDSELKVPADQDALTAAELLERVRKAIFAELEEVPTDEYSNRDPAISSLRRNLQRDLLERLAALALGNTSAPDDCRTVAALELERLGEQIDEVLESDVELDTYTLAHLRDARNRIQKVLDAELLLSRP